MIIGVLPLSFLHEFIHVKEGLRGQLNIYLDVATEVIGVTEFN